MFFVKIKKKANNERALLLTHYHKVYFCNFVQNNWTQKKKEQKKKNIVAMNANGQRLIDVPHAHVGPVTRQRDSVAVQQVSQPLLSSLSTIEMR